jgi:Flp pilus assembly protein TadB
MKRPRERILLILLGAFLVLGVLKMLVSGVLSVILLIPLIALLIYFIAVVVADFQRQRERQREGGH